MFENPKKVSKNDLRNSQLAGGLVDAETVNANRIGGDIYNIFLNQHSTLTRQEFHNRQILLAKVKKFWVKDVLEKSLYNQVLIELGLEERPDTIANPWNSIRETSENSPKSLPKGIKVIDIFNKIGPGRTLLILGNPGSGKTTTLLKLTCDLIVNAEQDINCLIPVVFNLSSWANKRQSLADWLVEELNNKYDIQKKIGETWVRQQQLLPLLDGLDEVKAEYRENCIAALNQFKQNYGAELVVCSRIKDYEALSNRLNFQSAIYLKSLTFNQICDYLDSIGAELIGLRALIEKDKILQELAKSPLMLNIMTLAYQGVSLEDLPKTKVGEERRKQLFDAYIEKMFKRRKCNQQYEIQKIKHWLIVLAQRMIQESQTVFLIEKMQPPIWLQTFSLQRAYIFLYGLILWLLFGLIVWLWGGQIKEVLGIGIFVLLIMVFSRHQSPIKPVEKLQWSWERGWRSLIGYTRGYGLFSLIFFVPIAALSFYFDNSWSRPIIGITRSIMGGFIAAIFFILFSLFASVSLVIVDGLNDSEIENKIQPNQGIIQSAKNATLATLISWLANALSWSLLFGLIMLLPMGKENIIEIFNGYLELGKAVIRTGLGGGLFVGIMRGGWCVIQHFSLRFILYYENYIPWNYARFLDYASDRIFLQKVGGGYIFIHRMLMEHFAQMKIE